MPIAIRGPHSMRQQVIKLATLIVFLANAALSQAQMEMPKPAPELKKLDFLAGTWTMDGDSKPGPMGPGGQNDDDRA